jgi:hypothetical protein
MLQERLINKESGYLFYGLTPPKTNNEHEKIVAIAQKQMERLKDVSLDALVLYDIQDESSRTDAPRPFPYMPTLAPDEYSSRYLGALDVPKIIYKSVGKFTNHELEQWVADSAHSGDCAVFVGSPSKHQANNLSLADAYKIKQALRSSLVLGGVTIPERHDKKGDEHLRLFDKIDKGCSFFISQCVYSASHAKNFLSDYYYASKESNRELVPIIFTLTPCGSVKTLQFMEWLGIDIPKWLRNDLQHANDILSKSIDVCNNIAAELVDYSHDKNIPIGFNIESVAIRKEEIEASIQLLRDVRRVMEQ